MIEVKLEHDPQELKEMAIAVERMTDALVDHRTAGRKFKKYILGKRLDTMFRNLGRGFGVTGQGMQKWTGNKPWTVGVKGHARPLHGMRDMFKSSLKRKFFMRIRHKPGGSDVVKSNYLFDNKAPYARMLHDGWRRHLVVAKNAKALMIPIGAVEPPEDMNAKKIRGKWFIFRKSVWAGAAPPRRLLGFVKGDLNWYANWWLREIEKAGESAGKKAG